MAKQLTAASIAAPGFYGLNTQASSVTLDAGFALQADNCVIDKYGRLGARKGYTYLTSTVVKNVTITSSGTTATVTDANHTLVNDATLGYVVDPVVIAGATQTEYNGSYTVTVVDSSTYTYTFAGSATTPATGTITATYSSDGIDIKGAHEFIDINGIKYFGCWSDTDFYVRSGSSLVQIAYGGTPPTTDGWQAATLNDYALLFHRDHAPIYFNPTTGVLADISTVGKGTPPQGNTVLSAFGRIWTADTASNKTTVYFSSLLDGTDWQTTTGVLELSSVLVKGNDEIVALGAHNGRLIIFCKNNIVIYGDSNNFQDDSLDVSTLQLVDIISGVGCVARDSVQNIGNDLVFLSATGIQSLGRVIQEKSQPLNNYSLNVRDDLVRDVTSADPETIKSAYCAHEAFYLLLIPEFKRVYCFDTRSILEDGSARVTIWDNQTHFNLIETQELGLVFCNANGLALYNGYADNGVAYEMKYYTNYFDFGDATQTKYLKRLSTTVVGGSGQTLKLKVGYDYDDSYTTFPINLGSQDNSEYGIAEYNTTAEYTVGTLADTLRAPMGGSGSVIQVGFEATINGTALSIQKLDIYIKQGRIY